jgi:hypothetical protein
MIVRVELPTACALSGAKRVQFQCLLNGCMRSHVSIISQPNGEPAHRPLSGLRDLRLALLDLHNTSSVIPHEFPTPCVLTVPICCSYMSISGALCYGDCEYKWSQMYQSDLPASDERPVVVARTRVKIRVTRARAAA